MFDRPQDTLLRAGMRIAPIRSTVLNRMSPEAAAVMTVGHEHHWPFRILGRAPLVEKPVYTGNWWIVPAHMDTVEIPSEVRPRIQERVHILFESGVRPKGFLIAHEVPKLLMSGKQEEPISWWRRHLTTFSSRPAYLAAGALVVAVVGPILLGLLIKLLLAVLAVAIIPLAIMGLGAAAVADPVLVLVTKDNYWIELDRWV